MTKKRPYPDGVAWDEAWLQRQRAEAMLEALQQTRQDLSYCRWLLGEAVSMCQCDDRDTDMEHGCWLPVMLEDEWFCQADAEAAKLVGDNGRYNADPNC